MKEKVKMLQALMFVSRYGTLICLFAMIMVFSILLPALSIV